jgi:hypothetical protein
MTQEKTPKAWLPAIKFVEQFALHHEALLKEVNHLGLDYKIRIWERNVDKYQLALTVKVSPSNSHTNQAVIELAVSKTHQSIPDMEALTEANFKRGVNTSSIWVRTMAGNPSPLALANHTLAGVEFAVGLKPDMAFEFQAFSAESQSTIEEILEASSQWKKNGTTKIWRLAK